MLRNSGGLICIIVFMLEPCKDLWIAVLRLALEDVEAGDFGLAWFHSASSEPGSMIWICAMLGIDAGFVQRVAELKWKATYLKMRASNVNDGQEAQTQQNESASIQTP